MNASLSTAAPWWRPNTGHRLIVRGGRPLVGIYPISGAKNAVLPLMVSALLTPHLVTLRNVPANLDVAVLAALLQRLGCGMHWSTSNSGLAVTIAADRVQPQRIDAELVTRMRASVLLLGALLARCGEAALPMPGGDAIGLRGIDFHVTGLRAMGATIELTDGTIRATARDGLRGADILLPQPSVGATENLLLAAVAAAGTTTIRNAAREPEIADLAACLIAMGARIAGLGTHVLTIEGGALLGGAVHAVLPDRIEFGTLACAAALTDGELLLPHGRIDLLGAAAASFAAAGVELQRYRRWRGRPARQGRPDRHRSHDRAPIRASRPICRLRRWRCWLRRRERVRSPKASSSSASATSTSCERWVRTSPYAAARRGSGASTRLRGAAVTCTDVRAAAALVLAGLGAAGETILDGLDHLDRGYDGMTEKLAACGADIARR